MLVERFSAVLREMGFKSSRAENDIWMQSMGRHYEYTALNVDNLDIISRRHPSKC